MHFLTVSILFSRDFPSFFLIFVHRDMFNHIELFPAYRPTCYWRWPDGVAWVAVNMILYFSQSPDEIFFIVLSV